MANFTPSKKTAQDFNNGQKYINGEGAETGDVITADMPNNVIEGFLYLQGLAVNQPDISEANKVGTASASIVIAADGTARLKFSNLKGKQGVGISTIVENGTDANGGTIYKITLDDGRTYNFVAPKGAKGDTGNGIASTTITYATSTSGTTAPTTGWQTTIPTVSQGQYLWTRLVITFTNNASQTSYNVSYQGKDSIGAVTSVNGQTGAVTITSDSIGAMPSEGGTFTGNITAPQVTGSNGVYDGSKRVWSDSNRPMALIYNANSITNRNNQTDTVVEYYRSSNGKTWYNIWASGRKECGGIVDGNNPTQYTITFPITFLKIPTVNLTFYGAYNTGGQYKMGINTVTSTDVTVIGRESASGTPNGCNWRAEGI